MKKRLIPAVCTMLSISILSTSCIGSFPLFHKIHSWNEGVSNSKFVNELVFICFHIIPVYEVCYLADGLIFNSIEFWSGKSPIAKVGEKKTLEGNNGDVYISLFTKSFKDYLVERAVRNYSEWEYTKLAVCVLFQSFKEKE